MCLGHCCWSSLFSNAVDADAMWLSSSSLRLELSKPCLGELCVVVIATINLQQINDVKNSISCMLEVDLIVRSAIPTVSEHLWIALSMILGTEVAESYFKFTEQNGFDAIWKLQSWQAAGPNGIFLIALKKCTLSKLLRWLLFSISHYHRQSFQNCEKNR